MNPDPVVIDPVVIVGARRTPLGAFQGALSGLPATALGALAIRAALDSAGVAPDAVSELLMGCVLPAGLGQAPARQAGIAAGLPDSVPATTVNKVCGSGMKTVMLAHDQILLDDAAVMVAGGMESMSNAPYLLDKARGGMRLGHGRMIDHMFLDGLEDAYDRGQLMGQFADATAEAFQFTREAQDDYARRSVGRAREAAAAGLFRREIVAVPGQAETVEDEGPGRARPEKIAQLKPAFRPGGTVTAATSASISDGAAALVLMRLSQAEKRGLVPIAAIRGHASFAQAPAWFTTAPVGAMRRLFERTGWNKDGVDLFEINEAFAAQVIPSYRELGIDLDKLNINGGAIALGHPFGSTGARITGTLINGLQTHDKQWGVETMCVGGGMGMAMVLERLG